MTSPNEKARALLAHPVIQRQPKMEAQLKYYLDKYEENESYTNCSLLEEEIYFCQKEVSLGTGRGWRWADD